MAVLFEIATFFIFLRLCRVYSQIVRMDFARFALVASTSAAIIVGLSISSCEEVLEVCTPCANVLERDVNISGDLRLDGTIDAVQRIRLLAEQAAATFDEDMELLQSTFGISLNGQLSKNQMGELRAGIQEQLSKDPNVDVVIALEPARCWVDKDLAIAQEIQCERRLSCNVPRQFSQSWQNCSCTGYFEGQCRVPCRDGYCFVKSGEGVECSGKCVGACSRQLVGLSCPGICCGNCRGGCSAYDSAGSCSGYCDDICEGTCESKSLFSCNSLCTGLCNIELGEEQECVGECRGRCQDENGSSLGRCRGHVRPDGFDEECGGCREMAKGLAWSALSCEPASVRVGLDFSGDDALVSAPLVAKVRVLERVMARVANDHAKLALLVDGVDDAGELQPGYEDDDGKFHPGYLFEETTASTEDYSEFSYLNSIPELLYLRDKTKVAELKIVENRKYLPLSNLKARVGKLAEIATQGDFKVAVGALSCVTPALEEAYNLLAQMIPVIQVVSVEGKVLEMDRSCSESTAQDDVPCLYRIVDGQAALLELAKPGD